VTLLRKARAARLKPVPAQYNPPRHTRIIQLRDIVRYRQL
jgi:hypothetical protein